MKNEGTINWLKKSIHTREIKLEELNRELEALKISIPQREKRLQKDKEELAHLEARNESPEKSV